MICIQVLRATSKSITNLTKSWGQKDLKHYFGLYDQVRTDEYYQIRISEFY